MAAGITFSQDLYWWWDGHDWRPTLGTPARRSRPPRDWRRYVPGFRTGSLWRMCVASLGYLGFTAAGVVAVVALDPLRFVSDLATVWLILVCANVGDLQRRGGWRERWGFLALGLFLLGLLLSLPADIVGLLDACSSAPDLCRLATLDPLDLYLRLLPYLLVLVPLYLAPAIVAVLRDPRDVWLAVAIDLTLGLTALGWAVALVLALGPRPNPQPVPMSEDRGWWWDGSTWISAELTAPPTARRSPDDTGWWDGVGWRPLSGRGLDEPGRSEGKPDAGTSPASPAEAR
ncbi:MAG TPA: superinfection immunity protein [Candidatus Dormibacteraeota bacterium]|nr:superinfection immunity protein [Candidatus Dormibacteraeota bacterium]